MLKYKVKNYLKSFSKKDIKSLSVMFSKKITLRDWKINCKGIKNVMKENLKIFKNCKSIKVKVLKIFQIKESVIAELSVSIDKSKPFFVIDVIEFDRMKKIKSIRAYIGS